MLSANVLSIKDNAFEVMCSDEDICVWERERIDGISTSFTVTGGSVCFSRKLWVENKREREREEQKPGGNGRWGRASQRSIEALKDRKATVVFPSVISLWPAFLWNDKRRVHIQKSLDSVSIPFNYGWRSIFCTDPYNRILIEFKFKN